MMVGRDDNADDDATNRRVIIIIVSSLHAGRRSGSDKLSAELQQARHPALKNAPMEGGYALNKNMAVSE